MSIATEISRLQTAKANIKTAIESKGVVVPDTATLDSYNTYVSQIQTGGGTGGDTNYLAQYVTNSLPENITSAQLGTNIGSNMVDYLFCGQYYITSVDLTGTGATKIANNFCKDTISITSIIIPDTVTKIGDGFCENTNISTFTIPSSITSIGSYFLSATQISSIIIPSNVTSLSYSCFDLCASLTQVTFNANIANIPEGFCINNTSLALVDLNSSVTSIDRKCFSLSSSSTELLEVILRNTNSVVTLPNEIGSTSYYSAFKYRRNIKLYVPSALKASYEADSNWAAGVTTGYLTIETIEGSQYE